MDGLPARVVVRRAGAGERWRVRGQGWLAAAFAGLAPGCAVLAWSAGTYPARSVAEERAIAAVAVVCLLLAAVSALMAVGTASAGLRLDPAGVTARGALMRRRILWRDVRRFDAVIEELVPNRPSAVVVAKLRDGRYVTLPGSRVDGLRWNLDRHREVARAMARELDRRAGGTLPGWTTPP